MTDGARDARSLAWCVEGAAPAAQGRAPDKVIGAAQLGVEGASQDDASAIGASEVDGALPPGVPGHATFKAAA